MTYIFNAFIIMNQKQVLHLIQINKKPNTIFLNYYILVDIDSRG